MKKRSLLLLAVTLLATVGQASGASRQSLGLQIANPEDVGVTWQECTISQGFDWKQAETCFGHFMPLWDESEKANFGSRLDDMESLQLTIGQDIYRASLSGGLFPKEKYTLYKNDRVIQSLYGESTSYSPNLSLQNIGGKAVWEFSDGNAATIIYDGLDVRQLYGLDKAYRPYGLDDKLIFIGQIDDKYFVVYDGWRIGPDFDEIAIAYCCEPVLWSVQYGQGKYLFWDSRDGQWYVVEIALGGK
jgi:hypothetical protein